MVEGLVRCKNHQLARLPCKPATPRRAKDENGSADI